jgi:hypothetical protein
MESLVSSPKQNIAISEIARALGNAVVVLAEFGEHRGKRV